VILTVEKLRQKAESTVHISGGEVYADAESEDMYAAIDMLTNKLDRQLIKQKEKSSDKKLKIR
ncbi:ribosome-associated translation inhibitor RaiA, partial [Pseudomonadales bacterium]|nr:ribosome-associated translation inhibitor RaiA [Pseudomonadales bacterium]